MSLPIVTSVFSLSVKQEEDLPFLDPPESETNGEIHPPVTSSPNVKPDILIRFKQERSSAEPQGSEERENLTIPGTCEELHEAGSQGYNPDPRIEILKIEELHINSQLEVEEEDTDTKMDAEFRNSEKMRMWNGQQIEEWKLRAPARQSPDPSAVCERGINRVKTARLQENDQKGERPNICIEQERNSNHCPNVLLTQRFCEGSRPFKNADTWEDFSTNVHSNEHQEKIECWNKFTDRSTYIQQYHRKEKNFSGTEGEKNTSKKTKLIAHRKVHRQKKTLRCTQCEKCFACRGELERHARIHSEGRTFQCTECEEKFTRKLNLSEQNKIHKQDEPCKSSECVKYLTYKSQLRIHQKFHKGQKPFTCSECDKSFSQKSDLKKHKMIHTGEKPFKCSECDKSFSEKHNMRRHEMTHTGEKPFKCLQCDKSFSQKCDLKKHERIHTGEKPFKCFECDKCFSQKGHLRRHEMTHMRDKPFKCSECDKTFSQKSVLRKHEMIHFGEKAFKCSEDDKNFSKESVLKKQEMIHTGENEIVPNIPWLMSEVHSCQGIYKTSPERNCLNALNVINVSVLIPNCDSIK
ncbi:gastrula zinc finger protein XlCGF26.1-like isoform X2 [Rhinatrema bivittatum]|nr:gastrula zinc finger protein XlCGF26.1-like isoform X2 [Rhinatrema bivittatum]